MESGVADTVSEGNGRHEFFMGFGSAGVLGLFVLLGVSQVSVFQTKEEHPECTLMHLSPTFNSPLLALFFFPKVPSKKKKKINGWVEGADVTSKPSIMS